MWICTLKPKLWFPQKLGISLEIQTYSSESIHPYYSTCFYAWDINNAGTSTTLGHQHNLNAGTATELLALEQRHIYTLGHRQRWDINKIERWNSDKAFSAGTTTYFYAGTSTTLEHRHDDSAGTPTTLGHRQMPKLALGHRQMPKSRWNINICVRWDTDSRKSRWDIDSAGASTIDYAGTPTPSKCAGTSTVDVPAHSVDVLAHFQGSHHCDVAVVPTE